MSRVILLIIICQIFFFFPSHSEKRIPNGDYAMVAGGSKGIGFAIAEALAKRHYNLILIARHENALQKAKTYFEKNYRVHVETLAKDLSEDSSATEIRDWCMEKKIKLKMLCNVAGFGGTNDFLTLPLDSLRYMVRLNVESVVAMTLTMLPLLEQNSPSYILQVASMAGMAPVPEKNVYAATKAAVLSFSYSLRQQLKEKNISVSCLCPGPVYTKPSIEIDTKQKLGWLGDQMAVPPADVGEIAVRKTLKKKMIIVPGTIAKTSSVFIRMAPKRWSSYFFHLLSKKKSKKMSKKYVVESIK